MTVFDVANFMTPFIESCSLFFLFSAFFSLRKNDRVRFFIIGILTLAVLILIIRLMFANTLLNNVFMIISSVCIIKIYLESDLLGSIIISVVGHILSLIIELLVLNSIMVSYHVTANMVNDIPEYHLLGVILSKITLLVVCYGIYHYKKRREYNNARFYWMIFFLLFIVDLFVTFLLFKLSYEVIDADYNSVTLLCTIGLFVCVFFVLFLYDHQEQRIYIRYLKEQEDKRLQKQIKYMDELMAGQEALNRFRHDISNQLIVLNGYLEHEDNSDGVAHIKKLMNTLGATTTIFNTGNLALDAILSTKKAMAKEKNIDFQCQIQIAEKIPMTSVDIGCVFGNALDNAIEACNRMECGHKFIKFILIEQNKKLFCKIVNSSMKENEGHFISVKDNPNEHGYGLLQIRETLEKYDCEARIMRDDDKVIFKFLIFME